MSAAAPHTAIPPQELISGTEVESLRGAGVWYILGPMSGLPEFNAPAFREAAESARELGFRVISPVELDEEDGFDHSAGPVEVDPAEKAEFLRRDLVKILSDPSLAGGLALEGWENSEGAALEVHVLRSLGREIRSWPDLLPVKAPSRYRPPADESVTEEAERLVGGDRGADYGHPLDDFSRTAGAAAALGLDLGKPEHVPLLMILVKLSRLMETPSKRDSVVDVCGYARTYEMVRERQGEPLR